MSKRDIVKRARAIADNTRADHVGDNVDNAQLVEQMRIALLRIADELELTGKVDKHPGILTRQIVDSWPLDSKLAAEIIAFEELLDDDLASSGDLGTES